MKIRRAAAPWGICFKRLTSERDRHKREKSQAPGRIWTHFNQLTEYQVATLTAVLQPQHYYITWHPGIYVSLTRRLQIPKCSGKIFLLANLCFRMKKWSVTKMTMWQKSRAPKISRLGRWRTSFYLIRVLPHSCRSLGSPRDWKLHLRLRRSVTRYLDQKRAQSVFKIAQCGAQGMFPKWCAF